MKKVFILLTLLVLSAVSASAQFEQGKKYVNANLTSAGISYSDRDELAFGFGAQGGYMIDESVMLLGEAGFDYRNSDCRSIYAGVKGRYYIEQNGIYLGCGARLLHEFKNYNDVQLTPEVGYAFFVSHDVVIEPSLYYDISLTDFSHKSKVGLKIGLGVFF